MKDYSDLTGFSETISTIVLKPFKKAEKKNFLQATCFMDWKKVIVKNFLMMFIPK